MPDIPALCDSCGTIFPSGIVVASLGQVQLSGNRSQCPRCGHMARIPDGVFRAVGNTLELLAGPERTVRDLQALADVLRRAREQGLGPEETSQLIREESAGLSSISDLVPQTRAELYAFISMLLAAVAILMTQVEEDTSEAAPIQNINIEKVVNQSITQVVADTSVADSAAALETSQGYPSEVGRNDPCPCGSGKKYKKCHGAPK